MPLEKFDRANIKNLAIKAELKEKPLFDWDKFISAKDFREMMEELDYCVDRALNPKSYDNQIGLVSEAFRQAEAMVLLVPAQKDAIISKIEPVARVLSFKSDKLFVEGGVNQDYSQAIANWLVLFPEYRQRISERVYPILPFSKYRSHDYRDIKMIFPEADFNFKPAEWQEMLDSLAELKNEDVGDLSTFISMAAEIRIFAPEKYKEFVEPMLDQATWIRIKKCVGSRKKKGELYGLGLSELVMNIKILAAKDVKVDVNGINLMMPEIILKPATRRSKPERRKF